MGKEWPRLPDDLANDLDMCGFFTHQTDTCRFWEKIIDLKEILPHK